MILHIFAILLIFVYSHAWAQPISHQNWQSATVASDAISVNCAGLLLPFELGRLLVENDPTTARGEMDVSLRSAHPVKVSLQPETGTSDQITSITGCTTNGATIQLATVDTGDSITIVHTPGVIEFFGGANVTLSAPTQILTLQRKSGIWVSDGGMGGGAGGNIEDLLTTCPVGQYPISDGMGNLFCGEVPYVTTDCSWVTTEWTLCWDYDDRIMYRGDGVGPKALNFVPRAADCSPYAAIGDLCIDSDDGLFYRGDGEAAVSVAAAPGGGNESLDLAFDLGKVIDGANSEANAMVVGNGTDGFKFFVGTGGPTIKCFQGANTCDVTVDIPTGNFFRIKYNGTDGLAIDSNGAVTLSNALVEYKSFWFGAGALSTDGTNCLNPEERQINAGPKSWTVACSDNNSSIIYGNAAMPDSYNGGTIIFELQSTNVNAAPSGTLSMSFSAMCRTDSETINAVWGTPAASSTAFTTQYRLEHSDSITITPQGTCAGGEHIFWRGVINEASTTTQMANVYLLGVKVEYPTNDWSDN